MNVDINQVALNIINGSLTLLKLYRIYRNMIHNISSILVIDNSVTVLMHLVLLFYIMTKQINAIQKQTIINTFYGNNIRKQVIIQ